LKVDQDGWDGGTAGTARRCRAGMDRAQKRRMAFSSRIVLGLPTTVLVAIQFLPACTASESVDTECYWVDHDQACKDPSAVTSEDFPTQGSMIFEGVVSGPTRRIDRTDCCSYSVTAEERYDCTLMSVDAAPSLCPGVGPTETIPMCLDVDPDASCPDPKVAAAGLQGGRVDVRIISVDSPATRKVSILEYCCYEVRRRWDGG